MTDTKTKPKPVEKPVAKPLKSISLKLFPGENWKCKMNGLITVQDLHRIQRIIRVEYRRHRLKQIQEKRSKG